jgi:3-oxoadipate enol-lactonase / 4-carboxymuconolactone decarboxylase
VSEPAIRSVHLAGAPGLPPLLVGPSLGTSVTALWGPAAQLLGATHRVVGWDLPGHGQSPPPDSPFTIGDLATAVLRLCDNEFADTPVAYAGVSVAGAVGLQMLLQRPQRFTTAALICTGARIGDPQAWHARAAQVRSEGTRALAAGSAQRWFAPGFTDRRPDVAGALLQSLREAHPAGYAATCEALAAFDVRARLPDISTPVVAIAAALDAATPPASLREISDRVLAGRFIEIADAAHLAPAEKPERTAELMTTMLEGTQR